MKNAWGTTDERAPQRDHSIFKTTLCATCSHFHVKDPWTKDHPSLRPLLLKFLSTFWVVLEERFHCTTQNCRSIPSSQQDTKHNLLKYIDQQKPHTGGLMCVQGGHGKSVLAQIPDGQCAILTAGGHDMQLSRVFVHTQQGPVIVHPGTSIKSNQGHTAGTVSI